MTTPPKSRLLSAELLKSLLEKFDAKTTDDWREAVKWVVEEIEYAVDEGHLDAPPAQCFWPSGCSDSARCREFGSCVAAHQNKHKDEISRPQAQAWVADWKATNEQIQEWALRHDLRGDSTELRDIFEDARTVHLLEPQPPEHL